MPSDPSFSIPRRPERRFPHGRGVEYAGGTVFELAPEEPAADLAAAVISVLDEGPYRYGDFYDLPMPVWLVRDEGTADVFRVAVRDGTVRLHVLPRTDPPGLRRFYERLRGRDPGRSWRVDRSVRSH